MHDAARGHFRAHARRRVRLEVTVEGPGDRRARRAQLVDASLGGAGLELEDALAEGDRVLLAITSPALWDPLRVPGRIAWVSSPATAASGARWRAGCAFELASQEAVRAVWEMLTALAED